MSEADRRVRVCDYDRVYGFREESPPKADQAAGHPFFGSFLWSEQRNERIVFKKPLWSILRTLGA